MRKSAEAFRTISEVADELNVPKHVLRFWEIKFPQIRPMKRGGGRRYYRPEDVDLLSGIRALLHNDGYTIKGVQKILKEQGPDYVKVHGRDEPLPAPVTDTANMAGMGQKRQARPTAKAGRGGATPRVPLNKELRTALVSAVKELSACRDLLQNQVRIKAPAKKRARAAAR